MARCTKSSSSTRVQYITNAELVPASESTFSPLAPPLLKPLNSPPRTVFTGIGTLNWEEIPNLMTPGFVFINMLELKLNWNSDVRPAITLGLSLEAEEIQLMNNLDRDSLIGLVGVLKANFEAKVGDTLTHCIHKQPINSDVEMAFSMHQIACFKCESWHEDFASDRNYFVDTSDDSQFLAFSIWKFRGGSTYNLI